MSNTAEGCRQRTLVGGHHVGTQLLHDPEAQVVLPWATYQEAVGFRSHSHLRSALSPACLARSASKQEYGGCGWGWVRVQVQAQAQWLGP